MIPTKSKIEVYTCTGIIGLGNSAANKIVFYSMLFAFVSDGGLYISTQAFTLIPWNRCLKRLRNNAKIKCKILKSLRIILETKADSNMYWLTRFNYENVILSNLQFTIFNKLWNKQYHQRWYYYWIQGHSYCNFYQCQEIIYLINNVITC